MSLQPCLTNKDFVTPLFALSGSGGGGGGGNVYPILSTIGFDPTFSTAGQAVMNVSTISQSINITEEFTVQGGHTYGLAWKLTWFVDGTWSSPLACIVGSLSALAGINGNFYAAPLGQTTANTQDGDYITINTTFVNNVPGLTNIQFNIQTVDYTYGSAVASNFSSIVSQVVNSPPVLIDFGPVA